MNVKELHRLTGEAITKGIELSEVSLDLTTTLEGDNGEMICSVEKAEMVDVTMLAENPDDSHEEAMFVLKGPLA